MLSLQLKGDRTLKIFG